MFKVLNTVFTHLQVHYQLELLLLLLVLLNLPVRIEKGLSTAEHSRGIWLFFHHVKLNFGKFCNCTHFS